MGLLLASGVFGLVLATYGIAKKQSFPIWIGVGIVATIALVLYVDMTSVRVWDGEFTLVFDVTVVDADTGERVPNVDLTIGMRAWEMATYPVDEFGVARFSHRFPCGGHDSGLGITQSSWNDIPLDWYQVTICTTNGAKQAYLLADVVGQLKWPMGDSALPPIVLEFERR